MNKEILKKIINAYEEMGGIIIAQRKQEISFMTPKQISHPRIPIAQAAGMMLDEIIFNIRYRY